MDDVPDASSSDETIVRAPGAWTTPSPAQPSADFLDAEMHRLLRFAEGASAPGGGFGNLDDDGRLQSEQPIETWVSTRMTYCFALGSLIGRKGDANRVDHGLTALLPGGCLRMYLRTVRGETRIPSFTSSSFAIRCSPQSGFSTDMRLIS